MAKIKDEELKQLQGLFWMGHYDAMRRYHDQILKEREIDPEEYFISMTGWIVRKEIQP